MKGLSSRFHLALGLSSLVVSLLLLALNLGWVPDREDATRRGRVALAEAVAVGSSLLLDEADAEDGPRLRSLLGFIVRRNPELLSLALRRSDGSLMLAVGEHAKAWRNPVAGAASDVNTTIAAAGQMTVAILRGRNAWGRAELRFEPLPSEGRWGLLASPALHLIGGMGLHVLCSWASCTSSAVRRARCSGLDKIRSTRRPAKREPSSRAARSPDSVSGRSVRPVCCPVSVHAVSPWRTR